MFIECNDVSLIGKTCKKSTMNIMLIPSNGKTLYFNLCSFKCIVVSKVQPTINILLILMNWILGHTSMVELGLLVLVCLVIDNPNKKWIVVPFINMSALKCLL
jgi:biotin transporter BioY